MDADDDTVIRDGMRFRFNRALHFRYRPDGYVEFYYRTTGRVVAVDGHSSVGMAYGSDGRVYLAHDGQVYTHRP